MRRFTLVALTTAAVPTLATGATGCGFDSSTLQFSGTRLEQAKCLLQPDENDHQAPARGASLPAPLESLMTREFTLDTEKFRSYLHAHGISENDIGGPLDQPVSHSLANGHPAARYFVIHDTSLNVCTQTGKFSGSDSPSASSNLKQRWQDSEEAHLFITRDGKSIRPQGRDFSVPWRATKLEHVVGQRARGIFLHVENVQLRAVDLRPGESPLNGKGDCRNDRIAQTPGFTDAQYDRLALAYLDASSRARQWLVPAYHVAIDRGIADGHDDPRNFDLARWGRAVCEKLVALGEKCE
ncbi:hypothetical protein HHL14_11660 [Paraburkholderia sp. G-4-1-8]|uniref:Uncharacterized protein n=1 Tax=Paraburkholderia antibiotica TaxID=2728839 RepID=A0A7X9X4X7_9BURK|nr:hypothetical protein [Paraburkholderia antibiotica]